MKTEKEKAELKEMLLSLIKDHNREIKLALIERVEEKLKEDKIEWTQLTTLDPIKAYMVGIDNGFLKAQHKLLTFLQEEKKKL